MAICFFYPFFFPSCKKLILLKAVSSFFPHGILVWKHLTVKAKAFFFGLLCPFYLRVSELMVVLGGYDGAFLSLSPSILCMHAVSALRLHREISQGVPCVHSLLAV